MLSIIIPLHVEPYAGRTVQSVLDNATGDIEVIPVFDGADVQAHSMPVDSRVRPLYIEHKGMRGAINAGIMAAQGKYVMKLDAHCAVATGFDVTLTSDMQPDWLMVPRRWALNTETWDINRDGRVPRDYHYLTPPWIKNGYYGYTMLGLNWFHYPKKWGRQEVSDTMSIQGSCWLADRSYFVEKLFPLDDRPEAYGPFAQECVELCNKYWLGGGQVKVNKKTYYCHFAKRKRHYSAGIFSRLHRRDSQALRSHDWCARHWMNDEEPGMRYKFEWLIEKFWPVPEWPEDWKDCWAQHMNGQKTR